MLIMNLVSGVVGIADVAQFALSGTADAAVRPSVVRDYEPGGTPTAPRSGACSLV